MVNILRVKTRWSGFTGAPGYTILHFRDFATGDTGTATTTQEQAQIAVQRTRTFFDAIKALIPASARFTVEPEVDMLEDSDGSLVNSFTTTPGTDVAGTYAGAYAAAAGAVINWRTGSIRNGRRIRGRTFLVPLAANVFGTDGRLTPAAQTTIATAAEALRSTTSDIDLGVYARPTGPLATDGQWVVTTGVTVPTTGAVLRSRRD